MEQHTKKNKQLYHGQNKKKGVAYRQHSAAHKFTMKKQKHIKPTTPYPSIANSQHTILTHPRAPGAQSNSRIHTSIILWIIRNLRPLPPDNLPPCGHQAQLTNIHLHNRPLRQHAQLGIHRTLRVFLHTQNRQLDRNT